MHIKLKHTETIEFTIMTLLERRYIIIIIIIITISITGVVMFQK